MYFCRRRRPKNQVSIWHKNHFKENIDAIQKENFHIFRGSSSDVITLSCISKMRLRPEYTSRVDFMLPAIVRFCGLYLLVSKENYPPISVRN